METNKINQAVVDKKQLQKIVEKRNKEFKNKKLIKK